MIAALLDIETALSGAGALFPLLGRRS